MNHNRLRDYPHHIRVGATEACSFVEGIDKADFLHDRRTQQAVIMNLVIVGEAKAPLRCAQGRRPKPWTALPAWTCRSDVSREAMGRFQTHDV